MPAFGDSLTKDQVQSLVQFLRAKTWISVPKPVPSEVPATDERPPKARRLTVPLPAVRAFTQRNTSLAEASTWPEKPAQNDLSSFA